MAHNDKILMIYKDQNAKSPLNKDKIEGDKKTVCLQAKKEINTNEKRDIT